MKRGLIGLSLIGNVALVAVLGARYHWLRSEPSPHSAPVSTKPVAADHVPLDPSAWGKLMAGDVKSFVERLKAEGFPPDVIRKLVGIQVDAPFKTRREAIFAKRKPYEYWKYRSASVGFGNPQAGLDAAARAELRSLSDEEHQLLVDLVGSEPEIQDEVVSRQRNYGDVSAETVKRIDAINKDYSDLLMQARQDMQGIALPSDKEKLKFLEQERMADLKATMTDEQWEAFNLRSSPTAGMLQYKLAGFDPSEEEYKKIYYLQKSFDDTYGTSYLTPEDEARMEQARPKLLADLKDALGPDRFAQYQISSDPLYQRTVHFLTDAQLPPQAANQLISLRQAIADKTNAIKADESLTPEQRYTNLSALYDQANGQVAQVIGAKAVERYQSNAGNWLDHIKPAKPPASSR